MNLFLRLFWLLLRTKVTYVSPLAISVIKLRVWPHDLDIFGHINNGRFLSIMDLGRLDMMVTTGFWAQMKQHRWFPLVGTVLIDYRRPLRPFLPYEQKSRLMGWDERWFYIEQIFVCDGALMARATVKVMVRDAQGVIEPGQALASINFNEPSPLLPDYAPLLDGRPRLSAAA